MKVLVVHNRYRSGAPSGENRVVDRERRALRGLGHQVDQFEAESDQISDWSLARKAALPARVIWSRQVYRDLLGSLRAQRPDVVHVHNTFPLLSPAVLYACRDAGVPVVITLHNKRLICASGNFFRNGTVCHDCMTGPAVQAVVHGCYKGSRLGSAAVVVSNTVHRQAWTSMVSAYVFTSASQRDLHSSLDLSPERVFVRYNLIPSLDMKSMPPEHTVMYAGRLDEPKGLRVLMAGWDLYLSQSGESGLRLVIAGAGVLEPEVTGWASTRPSVEVVGHADEARCSDLMARARAVLLPSICEETFGLVAVEAMAVGVPSIAAAHGALAELITPGVDGVLVPPADAAALAAAIADVGADPAKYRAYGDQARETYLKRFDPDRNLDQLVEIYSFAIANPA